MCIPPPPKMTCGFLIQLVPFIKIVYVTSQLRHSLVVHPPPGVKINEMSGAFSKAFGKDDAHLN